jgi:glucose/mannose-6-phosphate isomerase
MMKQLIEGFGPQLQESLEIAKTAKLSPITHPVHNIVIAGMGGSGIGGTIISALTAGDCTVPMVISKSYDIPAFVNEHTLFIACSFSGNTEETLTALDAALAQKAKIVTITSGGKMGEFARKNGCDLITIPGRSNSPRASIGYSFVQILKVLHTYGLIKSDYSSDIIASISLLASNEAAIQQKASDIAAKLKGKLPILYADNKLEGVLVRTMQQIAENAKHLSHVNVFPEMNHNELVGWEHPKEIYANATLILVRSSFEHPRTTMRLEICKEIFAKHVATIIELEAKGQSFTEQCLYLIHLLDWVSFYLAELNHVDPFPVDVINYLKDELAKK